MLRSFKSLKFSSRGTLSSLTADRQVLALTLLNVMFLCRRSTLVTAFCQKTQSLQRRVNRKASSSSGRLPLPSETWALKGNAHAYMIQYSYVLLFSQVSPTDFWYFSPFQHIQTHHVSCWGANHWWLPWRGPIKWEAAGRGCQDRIPCDDKGSPRRRREGEWAWKILTNFDKVTSGDMKEPFGCEHCVCVCLCVFRGCVSHGRTQTSWSSWSRRDEKPENPSTMTSCWLRSLWRIPGYNHLFILLISHLGMFPYVNMRRLTCICLSPADMWRFRCSGTCTVTLCICSRETAASRGDTRRS